MPESCTVDFWTHYSYLCLKSKVCPLKSVIKNLKGKELCFPVENIRREHWPFLLSALSIDQSLTKLWLWSNFPIMEYKEMSEKTKKKNNMFFPIPYGCTAKNIADICKCASQLLLNSKTLKVLMIENLCLRNEDIRNLSEGLKNSNIEKFSLAGCQLQEEHFEVVCRSLQSSYVSWIDFSMCNLDVSSLTHLCDLIKIHHRKRTTDLFPETLRYRLPTLDNMKGLRRISLNNNDICDKGVEILMESLQEDIWMKALDLQKCNIENEGVRSILKILKSNVGLQLLDLRQNKIDATLLDRIALQLSLNNTQKEIKFQLGDLWEPPKFEKTARSRIARTRIVKHATTSRSRSYTSMEKKMKANMIFLKEIEGSPIGSIKNKYSETKDVDSQTTYDFNEELTEVKTALLQEMRRGSSLKQLVKKYKLENSLLRKELDKMSVLENYILIDNETFVEITNIFEKFKKFLEAMKMYGLWECIEMLGVSEKSDIALKPYIIDTARKCMQLVENGTPSKIKSGTSSRSSSHVSAKNIPTERPYRHNLPPENNSRNVYESNEKAHKISKKNQELIYPKEQPPRPSKVMEVFMNVRDNYSKSILSHQVSKDQKNDHSNLEDHNKHSKKLQQAHSMKLVRSDNRDLVNKEQRPSNKKSVASQTPSAAATSRKSKTPSTSHEMTRRKFSPPQEIQSTTSVSEISADEHGHSMHASLKSSEYKSLPSPKSVSKKEYSRKSELSKSFVLSQGSSNRVLNRSSYSEKGISSDSESTLRSSKIPLEKLPSDKSSLHGDHHFDKNVKADVEHLSSQKTFEKLRSNSPVSSISSYSSRKKVKSDNSVGKDDSFESYLESVSDGSTDNDVKSLTLSEVYNSSKRNSDHSNHSNKSSRARDSPLVKATLREKDTDNSSEINPLSGKDETLRNVPAIDEKLPQTSEISKTKDSQPKQGSSYHEKLLKRNNSDSSIPSLSDITTVSSKSLNTDSVMGQLSDI